MYIFAIDFPGDRETGPRGGGVWTPRLPLSPSPREVGNKLSFNFKMQIIMAKNLLKQYLIDNTRVLVDNEKPLNGLRLPDCRVMFGRGLVHVSPRPRRNYKRNACVYRDNDVRVMTRPGRCYMLSAYITPYDLCTQEAFAQKCGELWNALEAAQQHYFDTFGNQNMEDRA